MYRLQLSIPMIKSFFILIAFIFLYTTANGQFKLSGQIVDEQTNETLAGVTLYLSDLKKGTVTDPQGRYVFEKLKPGSYLLEISFSGYKKRVERIELNSDSLRNFLLSQSVSELNEVVVTAVSRSTELKLSPVIIKPLDAASLYQNSSTNLIDALKVVPGVDQITTGQGISKPMIRGLGYNRVISLYNGIREEGQQWGDEHGIQIDEYSVDRIEIVKGPGSLMYGSDGIAGVLNFILPQAPSDGNTKTQFISNYQSNNNLMAYSLSNAGNIGGMQWLGRITGKGAGNYQNAYDGKVYNSGFKEYDGNLFLGLNKSWGYSHLHISAFSTVLNMVEGERDSLGNFLVKKINSQGSVEEVAASSSDLNGYQTGFPHQDVVHFRAMTNNFFLLKKGSIHLDLAYQNNRRKEYGDVLRPQDIDLFFDLNTFNYNLRYNFEEYNGWENTAGINGMVQDNRNKGLEFLIPEYGMLDAGLFLHTQKKIQNRLIFAAGLRYDNRKLNTNTLFLDSAGTPVSAETIGAFQKFAALNRSFHSYSGSIGISYQLNPLSTLKLNLSRGFRAPNIAELTSNGQHEGALRYEYGNQNLKAEISHQIDLAYYLNSDHITFEFTPFVNFISNYIYSKKLNSALGGDSIVDAENPVPAFQFSQSNANLTGGEIYLDIHPHPFDWLHIENSFSYVQASQPGQTDSTKYLPFIPAPKFRSELKAQFNKLGNRLSAAYIKLGADYYFAQNKIYSAFATETETPAYILWNMGMGTNFEAFRNKDFLSVYISVENLANSAYQSHLSRLKYAPVNPATGRTGVYNMGRNLSVKVILNI